MMRTLMNLCGKLWADDSGSVIASEYLMLGSVVTLGGAAGLTAMRDATNQEMREYGQAIHTVSRAYREDAMRHLPGSYSRAASAGATSVPRQNPLLMTP